MVECSTRSAPRAKGSATPGGVQVASTATVAPTERAARTTSATSVMDSSGFDGVSTQTRRVVGRNARASAPEAAMSTASTSSPQRASPSVRSRRTPWYSSRGTSTWSPGSSERNRADAAAEPDAKAAAAAPPWRAASAVSSAARLGLALRV